MKIRTFDLERIQSLYENEVNYNLTESGFHPYSINELLSKEQQAELHNEVLGYGQTNGSIPLREKVADLYKGLNFENILICNGSSEANYVACHTLLNSGDEVIIMLPNYMQIWGAVEELGAIPKAFHLKEENNWAPDLNELESLVSDKTRMIVSCNPNNPTGYVLSDNEMNRIVEIADSVGAWIFCDEVYRGAELNGVESSSFIGKYDKVLVSCGLSKAYALPGLRLGWLAGNRDTIANCWSYHDYTSITSGILSQKIAEYALERESRKAILDRNRNLLRGNLIVMQNWVDAWNGHFKFVQPIAGGMAYLSYDMDINSSLLSERLRKEFGVFIAAGDWFGMDGYIRIGIGSEKSYFENGLSVLSKGIKQICKI